MVSRSLRIKPTTLSYLERLAKEENTGITVFIRQILENFVDTKTEYALQQWEKEVLDEVSGM
jgi:hypothetical protein